MPSEGWAMLGGASAVWLIASLAVVVWALWYGRGS